MSCSRVGTVTEIYSPLAPLTKFSGGALDPVAKDIAGRVGKTPAQVLLGWCMIVYPAGHCVAMATSRNEEHQKGPPDVSLVLERAGSGKLGRSSTIGGIGSRGIERGGYCLARSFSHALLGWFTLF
ncbi:hypothetical protein HOY80DRAFT_615587 [Tuber brumale]|nr:hypothetical protein HOY80DRAFT_615587 [Tuber brumale]